MAFHPPPSLAIWGSFTWGTLFNIVWVLPERVPTDQLRALACMLRDLQVLLPCPTCRLHLREHMQQCAFPIEEGTSKVDVFDWVLTLHNSIRLETHKKPRTVVDIRDRFIRPIASKDSGFNGGYYMLLLVVILCGASFLLGRKSASGSRK